MNTPAVTNLLGARVRDKAGAEGTVMAIGNAQFNSAERRDTGGNSTSTYCTLFIALLLLDDRTFKTCSLEGWMLVAV